MYPRSKVHVHCWGGFGSQLLALALVMDLKRTYPRRDFHLVFHTSGVTRRPLEIQPYLRNLDYSEMDDFRILKSPKVPSMFWRSTPKLLLSILGIVIADPALSHSVRVFPWTRSIRGHYSYRAIDVESIKEISTNIQSNVKSEEAPDVFVHYRLGDLMRLDSKSFISPEIMGKLLNQLSKDLEPGAKISVGTENPRDARTFLRAYLDEPTIKFENYSPDLTLSIGLNSKIFIGTNSKLSLWVAILRSGKAGNNLTYLPEDLARNIRQLSRNKDFTWLVSY